jgi:hypothetical protein
MPSERGLFKAQFIRPRAHDFGWNTAEPVLNLRNERVIFQAEARGEIGLRQFGIRPALLQPVPGQFTQLLGVGRSLGRRTFSENVLMFRTFHVY